jgi:hypothetical protein
MNNIEELLWDYIDGNCPAAEQKTVSALIETDEVYRLKYEELLKINREFSAMELDAPPMAFTYQVMEAIRAETAQKPLKTVINDKIMMSIVTFFAVTIMLLLVYTLININWSVAFSIPGNMPGIKLQNLSAYITKPVKEGFLFTDLLLALFLTDHYFRKSILLKRV